MRRHRRSTGGKTEREYPVSIRVFVWSSASFSKFRETVSRLPTALLFLGRSKRQRCKSLSTISSLSSLVYRLLALFSLRFRFRVQIRFLFRNYLTISYCIFRFCFCFLFRSYHLASDVVLFRYVASRSLDDIPALFFLTKFRARSISGNTGCCRPVCDCSRTLRYIQSFQRPTGLPNLPVYNSRY